MDIEGKLVFGVFGLLSLFIAGCAAFGWTYLGQAMKRAQSKSSVWPVSGFISLGLFWALMIGATFDLYTVSMGHQLAMFASLVASIVLNAGFNFKIEE